LLAPSAIKLTAQDTPAQNPGTFLFPKSPAQRGEWFGNTFDDVQTVERWLENNYFPRRGESCNGYGKACDYIDICHLDMDDFFISEQAAEKELAKEEVPGKYHVEISLDELMQAQIAGGE